MRFIDFFAGVGGFRRGFELSGHRCVGFCEWNKYATASYTSMHLINDDQRRYLEKMTLKQRQKEILKDDYRNGEWFADDIMGVDAGSLPDADCWTFGAPCFLKGTMITTHRGIIPIEEIQSGDYVLTHKNRFQRVVKPMINVKKGIYILKVKGSPITEVTGNHRFYVRDKKKIWNTFLKKYEMYISDPYWKEIQNFDGNELVQFTINKKTENIYDLTEEECWLIGRYIADGYIRDDERKDRPSRNQKVIFCIGKGKEDEFNSYSSLYSMSKTDGKNVNKYITGNKKLFALCSKCGRGAENKIIPQFILNLDPEMIKFFISGYMSGDGSISGRLWKATSVSKKLIYQLGQCVSKAYGVGYSIYFDKRPEKCTIEGRMVNQKDTWSITFRLSAEKMQSYYIDGSLWQPVRNIEYNPKRKEIVYNMEVENDNSYTVNNMGVHNCQDFSIAGKRKGLGGSRSVLVREIFRLLEEQKEQDRPEWLIYENVKGMLSSNRGLDYLSILSEMDRLGYDIQWQNMHTEWYLPQHRERIYTIGHLRRYGTAEIFPITGTDGENRVQQIGMLKSERKNCNAYRCYVKEGISPTLGTMQGGGREPNIALPLFCDMTCGNGMNISEISRTIQARYYKGITGRIGEVSGVAVPVIDKNCNKSGECIGIKIKEATKKGYDIAENGDSINLSVPGSKTRRGRVGHGVAQTLDTKCSQGTIVGIMADDPEDLKDGQGLYVKLSNGAVFYCVYYEKCKCYITIRRLTPRECFRLQGWTDEYFDRAAFVNSDSQLYMQAGNGVSIPVVKAIGDRIAEYERKRFEKCMNKPERTE